MATESTQTTQTQVHDQTQNNTETQTQSHRQSAAAASARGRRASRRRVLGSATKAAVATLAAGALVVEGATRTSAPVAHATGSEGPTVFTATGTTTAVTAFAQSADAVYGQTSDTTNQSAGVEGVAGNTNTYGVRGQNTGGGTGVVGLGPNGVGVEGNAKNVSGTSQGAGVYGTSDAGWGVLAESASGTGVEGDSGTGTGVYGNSTNGDGMYGVTGGGASAYGVHAKNLAGTAILGDATNNGSGTGTGVQGKSDTGTGVYGSSASWFGVEGGSSSGNGVVGASSTGTGVFGSSGGVGVYGLSNGSDGVAGQSSAAGAYGVHGVNQVGTAIYGDATDNGSGAGTGVQGKSDTGYGLEALSGGTALHAKSSGANGVAAKLEGLLQILGGAVGEATLAAGASSVTVPSTAVTASSLILLMPLGNPQGSLWVGNIAAGASFTINLAHGPSLGIASRQVLATPLTMRYLIIN